MTSSLSVGAIARYQRGDTQGSAIVKVLNVRACETPTTSEDNQRFRLLITDGQETFAACMLSPKLNELVKEKRLTENTIVKLESVVHHLTSTGKAFLSILDLTIIPRSSPPASTNICPIGMITPYINGLWKIRARCFSKSPVRPHPVCDFDFVDTSGEIRVVAFRDECTRFHPIIELNKVYDVMGVRIKTADKRWNSLHHTCELTLTPASVVRPVDDPQVDASIPDAHFDFVPLRDVSKRTSESFIDVIGIVESCTAVIPFVSRTSNRDSKRRELTLVDEETSISITLWDEQAENFDEELAENKAVVAFQRIRVAIYNNKYSLSGHKNMLIKANPDVPEAKHLRIWCDAGGRLPSAVQPDSSAVLWKSIGQIEREQLGRTGRPDFITIKGMCMHIANDRVVYMSCSNAGCSRKVTKLSSGLYRCDKCEKEASVHRWSYMLRAELVDSTGSVWVTFFSEQARELMGNITAEQFAQAKEDNDEMLMQTYLNQNCFRERIFRLRVHENTFNDMTMVRISCLSITDLDFVAYGRRLIANLQK